MHTRRKMIVAARRPQIGDRTGIDFNRLLVRAGQQDQLQRQLRPASWQWIDPGRHRLRSPPPPSPSYPEIQVLKL